MRRRIRQMGKHNKIEPVALSNVANAPSLMLYDVEGNG